jgi:hypothetical protein
MNIMRAWDYDTSSDATNWREDNPAWGQCAVTALVVQDLLGGDLLRGLVNGVSHYWNRLPNGQEIDLTIQQFGTITERQGAIVRERDYVLSFPETAKRYELLRKRVQQ